ncbi:MAG TPA: flagellar biosynthesis protein FlhB [bacterium]|nr:flagellar biosynthesis protein FlhB [bacterium]
MEEQKDQRTEKPTHRKKEKAREKAHVARSTELTAAIVIVGGIIALRALFPWFMSRTAEITGRYLSTAPPLESSQDVQVVATGAILRFFGLVGPFLAAVVGMALAANYVQVGFLFSSQPLALSLDRINPISGMRRLFSMRSLMQVVISSAKAALVGMVFYYSLKGSIDKYFALADCSVGEIVSFMVKEIFRVCMRAGLVLLLLGFADYAYQKREYIKSLMMTKQELKEEYKEIDGSPLIKSRIRAAQRALARRRMMAAVPTADVVVTNPTHIAVALKYDGEKMAAPTVVAKGQRLIAEKIKEIAMAHGVPIFENKPLAHSLYDLVEVGTEIPASLYKAVAEVLSYVYRLNGKLPRVLTNN